MFESFGTSLGLLSLDWQVICMQSLTQPATPLSVGLLHSLELGKCRVNSHLLYCYTANKVLSFLAKHFLRSENDPNDWDKSPMMHVHCGKIYPLSPPPSLLTRSNCPSETLWNRSICLTNSPPSQSMPNKEYSSWHIISRHAASSNQQPISPVYRRDRNPSYLTKPIKSRKRNLCPSSNKRQSSKSSLFSFRYS